MMKINITVSDKGEVEIIHPDDAQGMRDTVYFLELAIGTVVGRSLRPIETLKMES